MNDDLELEKKTYTVNINGHMVEFTVYGEEDDLETLEMFISFLMNASAVDPEEDDE